MSCEMTRRPTSRALLFPLLASFLPLRNTLAEVTPIVYVFGDDVGPLPPWGTSMIEGDPLLRWRGRPSITESWIHIFAPAQSAAAQRQLIGDPPLGTPE
jgi:hypothetical protein